MSYVVTMARQAHDTTGLRRMPLAEAQDVAAFAARRGFHPTIVATKCQTCDGMGREVYTRDNVSLSTRTCTTCSGEG